MRWVAMAGLVACACQRAAPAPTTSDATASVAPARSASLAATGTSAEPSPPDASPPEPPTALPSRERLLAPVRGTAVRGFVAMTGGPRAHVVHAVASPESADRPVVVASFTKLWVAVAVLRIVAQEKLTLDDTIATHLPPLAKKPWADSTVRELLHHVSRVPEFEDGFFSKTDIDFTIPTPVLAKHIGAGTEKRGNWKYRNSEFAILGAILQERAGKPTAEVLEQEVFTPAGMTHSGILVRGKPADLDLAPMGSVRPQNFFTAGNGYASPNDLLAFFDALDGGTLLDETSRALLVEADPKQNHAAFGCWAFSFPTTDGGTTLLVERPGSFGNVRLETVYFPALHRAAVLWSQSPVELGRPRTKSSIAAALARAALEQ